LTDNQPHFIADGTRIWSAKPEGAPGDRYLAFFNTTDAPIEVGIALDQLKLAPGARVTDLWSGAALGRAGERFAQTLPSHGAGLYRLRG
jgi:hypothetical protein